MWMLLDASHKQNYRAMSVQAGNHQQSSTGSLNLPILEGIQSISSGLLNAMIH